MRQIMSKLESAIIFWIDTGCDRSVLTQSIREDIGCTRKETTAALKKLRAAGVICYGYITIEHSGKKDWLEVNWQDRYGKEISYEGDLGRYSYEDGQPEPFLGAEEGQRTAALIEGPYTSKDFVTVNLFETGGEESGFSNG